MITMRLKTRNTAPDDDDGEPGLPVSRRSALSRHFASAGAAGRCGTACVRLSPQY